MMSKAIIALTTMFLSYVHASGLLDVQQGGVRHKDITKSINVDACSIGSVRPYLYVLSGSSDAYG